MHAFDTRFGLLWIHMNICGVQEPVVADRCHRDSHTYSAVYKRVAHSRHVHTDLQTPPSSMTHHICELSGIVDCLSKVSHPIQTHGMLIYRPWGREDIILLSSMGCSQWLQSLNIWETLSIIAFCKMCMFNKLQSLANTYFLYKMVQHHLKTI